MILTIVLAGLLVITIYLGLNGSIDHDSSSTGYWTMIVGTRGNGSTDKTSQNVPVGTDLQVTALETSVGSQFDHWESEIPTINSGRVNPITVPSQLDHSANTLTAVFVHATPLNITFKERAVWIMNTDWSNFPTNKQNVLIDHLDEVVTDLENNKITMAFAFVGYWNRTTNTIGYTMTDAQITTAIDALHVKGIKVLAWAEDDGQMDIVNNRQVIYNEITKCMNKGFDGYHDDIESYTANCNHQDYIDYLNNATTLLHGMSKLMTAAVGFDWQQNTNPYLHMDYIVNMFYSNQSKCEDSQGKWYWQENFGQFLGNNNPPASPVIIGLMNYYGNRHSLAWQLDWVTKEIALDPHPQLTGSCIWLYEYMAASDWQTWKYWIG